eukprot:3032319-Pleurochrysis_carterae.AAC.1
MLLLGVGVSIRIQDVLRSMPEEMGIEHDRVVSKIKWTKPGHAIWVVAPLDGILKEWTWGVEHARPCVLLGNVFPEFERIYGDGGRVSKSKRLALWDILAQEPYAMGDGERVELGISGHS